MKRQKKRWDHLGIRNLRDAMGLVVRTRYDVNLRGGQTITAGTKLIVVSVWRGQFVLCALHDPKEGPTLTTAVRGLDVAGLELVTS